MASMEQLNKAFLEEYNSKESLLKYSTRTAGHGINYLLEHDYADVYKRAIDACLKTTDGRALRILEFGCGAGMNLIALLSLLQEKRVAVEYACGTDFSESLIQSAKNEARALHSRGNHARVSFHVARNERLSDDLAAASATSTGELQGSFNLVLGVNTFRYCHRLNKQDECAADIYRLLRRGGVCVMIDMNDRFPLFRSRFKSSVEKPEEAYLPTLEEYTAPFARAGFEITTKDNFCWIPHSAGPALTAICRALTPILNATARSRAMRSLVLARKPA